MTMRHPYRCLTMASVAVSLALAGRASAQPASAGSSPRQSSSFYFTRDGSPYTLIVPPPAMPAAQAVANRPAEVGAAYGASVPESGEPAYYSEYGPYPTATASSLPANAVITVRLPRNAELWIDEAKVDQEGTVRAWATPPLDPERVYHYRLRARWVDQEGINVTKRLEVKTFAGNRVVVNLIGRPPRPAEPLATPMQWYPIERQPLVWRAPIP